MKKKLTSREKIVKSLEKEFNFSFMPSFKWYEEKRLAEINHKHAPERKEIVRGEDKVINPFPEIKLNNSIVYGVSLN